MRPKSLILLGLALGCGLIASVGISQVMEARRGQQQAPTETQLVLVAMARIDRNTELSAENLRLDAIPVANVPPDALTNLEEVEGRRPSTVIYPGSIVLEPMLGTGEGIRASEQVPEGMRVVAVSVDNTSGAGLIRPGDRVDVQVYARKNQSIGIREAGTWNILQDVSVFAVDSMINDDETSEAMSAKTISLLVTPEQSARVILASEIGTIRLVMRGLKDKTAAEEFNIGIPDLLGDTEKLGEKEEDDNSGSALADFLNGQTDTPEPVTESEPQISLVPPGDNWQMRILTGMDVRVERFVDGEPLDYGAERNSGILPPVVDPTDDGLPQFEPASAGADDGPAIAPADDDSSKETEE
ncbi:MAG: Flp pilus assembly protein CpaB [Planctomycetota bacterium]|nr:MAG: Flp pilus assembly protein CpaB [Planctomycetota bacterium]REJ88950.1 MAG: Flp pilus assembly protein CpaB [Planctomycetota bacterium]REK18041.1 MAG: Flp pilus assembly protein CpaB [Planctomycetota bacterium]REK42340.1 MAG: Flp pilus assembly protein CpaB [Planctomycetota bacterium]